MQIYKFIKQAAHELHEIIVIAKSRESACEYAFEDNWVDSPDHPDMIQVMEDKIVNYRVRIFPIQEGRVTASYYLE